MASGSKRIMWKATTTAKLTEVEIGRNKKISKKKSRVCETQSGIENGVQT